MDVNSGHLVADIESVNEAERSKYTKVPKHLEDEAREALTQNGLTLNDIIVNLKGRSNLAEWANKKRTKARIRRKISKASRLKNRR